MTCAYHILILQMRLDAFIRSFHFIPFHLVSFHLSFLPAILRLFRRVFIQFIPSFTHSGMFVSRMHTHRCVCEPSKPVPNSGVSPLV